MSDSPSESSGLTSGDPLQPGARRAGPPPPADADRPEVPDGGTRRQDGESGLPVPESVAARRDEPRLPLPDPPAPEYVGGYTSAPPPGAFGGSGQVAPPPAYAPGAMQLAGWWSRVAATLIDGLIIGVGGILLMVLMGAVFSVGFFASDEAGIISLMVGLMLAFLAFAVIALLYAPLLMARTNGQTFGRMAVGIRVIRTSGEPMTFSWAMLREVVIKWLLFGVIGGSITFGLIGLLDVLWPLWDEENRALHDFIVSTRVVRD